jgi:hypothetical protein
MSNRPEVIQSRLLRIAAKSLLLALAAGAMGIAQADTSAYATGGDNTFGTIDLTTGAVTSGRKWARCFS